MQLDTGLKLLTTGEAAAYLRLKERKLYELVAERRIPCTKVTGKWLFPRTDLDRWLLAGMARPHGVVPAEPPPIVGGSHDPLLQWALSESRAGLAIMPEGSETGLRRFLRGELIAAAIHFHDPADCGKDANLRLVSGAAEFYDAVLIAFAAREQGLLVAPGNPLGLAGMKDAVEKRARFVMRPEGAGAHQLMQAQVRLAGATLDAIVKAASVAPTGPDIAQAIRAGTGDCGIATRAVAAAAAIDFIPICSERFDLVMRQRDYFRPPMQALLSLLRQPRFAEHARELGGLDVSEAGAIRWAP